jgi:hypothetical protein
MMKLKGIAATIVTIASMLVLTPAVTLAAFVSGSTGVDGDFTPTTNTILQIPESGVFNFGSVTIPSGVTVTFKKNSSNTPVIILATGDVTISGTISISGSSGSYTVGGVGGPGGFSGGAGGVVYQNGGRGEGPGGAGGGTACATDNAWAASGGGGGFGTGGGAGSNSSNCGGTVVGSGGITYGNDRILPSMGGSGGGGAGGNTTYVGGAGGGGGGAIIIASSSTITVSGSITANGGNGASTSSGYYSGGGGGSGGSIRLIAETISGNGPVTANGGSGGGNYNGSSGAGGGGGRIRLEANNVLRTSATSPNFTQGAPYGVAPLNVPTLTITSIGGVNVPTGARGSFSSPDVILPFNTQNPVNVVVTGVNIPLNTTVTVKSTPSVGTSRTATATLTGADISSTTATASLNISIAYPSIITTSVTFQLAAAGIGPIYAEGERVDKIKVAANLGGKSTVTYITESGREVPAVM